MLRVVHHLDELRAVLAGWRGEGARIALVPTMGNLHAGHLRLVERAAQLADRVCVSIFVNPLQFDRAEDLAAYPRTLDEDRELLAQGPAHLLYAPSAAQMYPRGEEGARVAVPGISDILEGASRPGHFSGVATVVGKFFNRVQPDLAVFGEKDFQQLLLIRRMVAELDFPVEIIGEATVREADGLAMSSRNAYLSAQERRQAPRLYARLSEMAEAVRAGRHDFTLLALETAQSLEADGFRPDYVTVRRVSDLLEPQSATDTCIILAAAWLGRARLIDNIPI